LIALEGVAARRAPLALANITLAWGPGIHAVLGGSADGGPLLLSLIAGAAPPRAGRLRVLDGAPTDDAVRAQVAFVPLEPALPEAMRVAEVLAIAAAIRGEPAQDASERLSALGIETLASRRVGTLSPEETKAVAIAEAATSTRVRVLLIEEPLVRLDPRAAARLPEVVRARSRDGRAVVVATASVRDAAELADDHVFLRGGAVVGKVSTLDALVRFSPQGVRLRILASDARALAAALAREEEVEAVGRRDASVVVRGRDAVGLARAAGRAIVASGVDVTEMRVEPPSLEEVHAAIAGMATATYDPAARARAPASLDETITPPGGSGTGPPTTSGERGP
jgi:ABC-2 type transport system ATP-binding protein